MKLKNIDYRVWVATGVMGFFAIAALYAWEFNYFNRYLSFTNLMIVGLLTGALLGGLAAWRWGRQFSDSYDRMRFNLGVVLAGLVLGPLLVSLTNRLLDFRTPRVEAVEFVSADGRYKSRFGLPDTDEMLQPNTYHLYFYHRASLERVIFDESLGLEDRQRGDTIALEIRPGLLGLPWVHSLAE